VLLVFSVVCIGLLSTLKKNKKLDPYVTLLGLLGTGSTGLHLQEKSIECAGSFLFLLLQGSSIRHSY
jgi:hypothetical protein